MSDFKISEKGWLITHSNEDQVRINLNNVTRIQTWISRFDMPSLGPGESYNIAFELSSKVDVSKLEKGLIDTEKFDQTHWGFENVFILSYPREELWNEAMKAIDKYINS